MTQITGRRDWSANHASEEANYRKAIKNQQEALDLIANYSAHATGKAWRTTFSQSMADEAEVKQSWKVKYALKRNGQEASVCDRN